MVVMGVYSIHKALKLRAIHKEFVEHIAIRVHRLGLPYSIKNQSTCHLTCTYV